jgi:hypothetical protein
VCWPSNSDDLASLPRIIAVSAFGIEIASDWPSAVLKLFVPPLPGNQERPYPKKSPRRKRALGPRTCHLKAARWRAERPNAIDHSVMAITSPKIMPRN